MSMGLTLMYLIPTRDKVALLPFSQECVPFCSIGTHPPTNEVVQGTPMDLTEANLLADEMCISDFLTQFDWYFVIRPMTYRELGRLVAGEKESRPNMIERCRYCLDHSHDCGGDCLFEGWL